MQVIAQGAELNVEIVGSPDGPTLVLLHAFPLRGAMWSAQCEELAHEWRLVVPDCRGFGASSVGDGQFAIDFFVDDLFAILDQTDPGARQPVVACGLSMGGYVLLRALERERERFRGLILADTKSGADDDRGRLKRLDAIRMLRTEGAGAYAAAFAAAALGEGTKLRQPDIVRRVQAFVRSNPVAGMVGAQLAMAARTDTTAVLSRIDVPTLVVVGEDDKLTPPSAATEMAALIVGARLEVIPKSGHLPPLEAPGAFNTILKGFLDQLRTG